MMRKFLLKFCLFMVPLALVFLPATYHLESFRELESIASMTDKSQSEGALIGLAYTDPMHLVEHRVLERRQPEIIALGTSRALPFRSYFFNGPESFYNCGRSVGKVQDLEEFLGSYPGKEPRVIILCLDQDFFGIDDEDLEKPPRSYLTGEATYGTRLVKGTKALFDAVKEGDAESGETLSGAKSYIGRNARLYYEGYRRDGSYLYGRNLREEEKEGAYTFGRTIRLIEENDGRFASAYRIHPGAVGKLEEFIGLCGTKEIHVTAFLPPYAHRVYLELEEKRPGFPHVFKLRGALEPILRQRGFTLFDFSDLQSLGSNDYETYDGFHASETAYLKLIREMAEADPVLEGYLDMDSIDEMIANAHSARQVIGEVEESHPERPAPGR